jgi:hypothetical protein
LFLARELYLNVTGTQSTTPTSSAVLISSVNSVDSLIEIDKLDIAVKRLAGDTLHDNVNWLILLLVDDARIAAKVCKDLRAGNTIRNLRNSSVRFRHFLLME